MFGLDIMETLFVATALIFQVVLIVHFALRKWRFNIAMRYGPIVYALSIPAALVSIVLLLSGKTWPFWLSGFIYLIWSIFGYIAEYKMKIEWRNTFYWPVFVPYVVLYLATVMFYWFPLGLISKLLWFIYATLFIISTVLNVTSHKVSKETSQSAV